jgi:O-antigen ligase
VQTAAAAPLPAVAASGAAFGLPRFTSSLESLNGNSLQRMGLYFALGFIFVRFTFLHEILALTFGVRSFLPPLLGFPTLIAMVASGGLKRMVHLKASWFWLLFNIWLIMSVPTSSWPGGSATVLTGYLEGQFPIFLFLVGLVVTWRDLKLVFYTIAVSGIVNEISARFMSHESGGRLTLEIVTIGNANDFAAQLLLMMPLLAFVMFNSSFSKVMRLLVVPVFGYAMFLVLRTGSRGAVVAIGVTYLFLLIRLKGRQRLMLGAVGPLAMVLVLAATSERVVDRLSTLFGESAAAQNDSEQQDEARQSTAGRQYLFMRSVEMTLEHPIFGVGLGEFSDVEGADAKSKGMRGQWMQTHNSYAQISSEAGIPALLLLLASLIAGYRNLSAVARESKARRNPNLEGAALAVMISFVAFCVSAIFLSLAYRFYFATLIGLAISVYNVARNEFEIQARKTPATA